MIKIEEEKKYKQAELETFNVKNRFEHIDLNNYKIKLVNGRMAFTKP